MFDHWHVTAARGVSQGLCVVRGWAMLQAMALPVV